MSVLRIAIFGLASAGLIFVSRASLRRPHRWPQPSPHGFYRFWAWEAIVALILLNAPVWFREPLAWHQVVSWLLLLASLVPLVLGLRLLGRAGRVEEVRSDAALLGFEKTAELVTSGIYRYIRHPMYSSLLLLAWGAYFKAPSLKAPSLLGAALVLAATGFLIATARTEERENLGFFGPAYATYMRRTRMFIPFVF
jgi:protein-S-isoprenylcysteine O-methyltransferase Ste14